MKKSYLQLAVASALLAGSAVANAIVIDDFTNPVTGDPGFPQDVTVITPATNGFSESDSFASIIGPGPNPGEIGDGQRDLQVLNAVADMGFEGGNARARVAAGALSISNEDGIDSDVYITWDGDDNSANVTSNGLGGIDLTADGALGFYLSVLAIDLNVTITVEVWDTIGGQATYSETYANPVDSDFYAFTSFLPLGDVDFTTVGAIQMRISGPTAYDARIDFLETRPTGDDVPTPATVALIGLGLAGMGALRRRAK